MGATFVAVKSFDARRRTSTNFDEQCERLHLRCTYSEHIDKHLRRKRLKDWWARQDLNLQPDRYERPALTKLSYRPTVSDGKKKVPKTKRPAVNAGREIKFARQRQLSRKLRSLRERLGCLSLRKALASI